MYRAAARDPAAPGACEAALAAARLAGDVAHDAVRGLRGSSIARSVGSRRFARRRRTPAHRRRVLHARARSRTRSRVWPRSARRSGCSTPSRWASRVRGLSAPWARAAPLDDGRVDRREAAPDRARRGLAGPRGGARRRRARSPGPLPDRRRAAGRQRVGAHVPRPRRRRSRGGAARPLRARASCRACSAEATSTGSRVSLDVDGRAWRRAFAMRDPYRIVIDVAHHPPGAAARARRAVARLVLDPGHGGKDTGAVGPGGLKEKDVTLDVARRVAPILGAQGIQVVLTRDDDQLRVARRAHRARQRVRRRSLRLDPLQRERDQDPARRRDLRARHQPGRDRRAGGRARERDDARPRAPSSRPSWATCASPTSPSARHASRSFCLAPRARRSASATATRSTAACTPRASTCSSGADMPSVLFETSYISNVDRRAAPRKRRVPPGARRRDRQRGQGVSRGTVTRAGRLSPAPVTPLHDLAQLRGVSASHHRSGAQDRAAAGETRDRAGRA